MAISECGEQVGPHGFRSRYNTSLVQVQPSILTLASQITHFPTLTANSTPSSPWEDYKKRDAQKINHYYVKRTAVVDLGQLLLESLSALICAWTPAGKWVLDLGNMSAHSKGKSPCRSVRGMHANGTAVHAFMSPTGQCLLHQPGLGDQSSCHCRHHWHLCDPPTDIPGTPQPPPHIRPLPDLFHCANLRHA